MLARYLNAPLLLLLWQVAPVDLHRDEGGRIRIALGAGSGRYSFRDYPGYPAGVDCNGDSYSGRSDYTEADDYRTVGISGEGWASKTLRIRGAVGRITDGSGERHGEFGAAQAVYEQKNFGLGLGVAAFGGIEGKVEPSGSARYGRLDGVSVRADYRAPEALMGLIGAPRIGVAVNRGGSRKPSLFAGLATTPVPDSARRVGGFVQVEIPLRIFGARTGLSFSGFLSGTRKGNEDKQIFGFGLAGWLQP
ncbi:MAG TPA: hypothetical protein VF187_07450 [Gemmatimonadales bacterium]